MTDLQQKITAEMPDIEIRFNELLSQHTSFHIGGPAEIMLFPKSAAELRKILQVSAFLDTKPVILGAGTNVLAPDQGVEGVVICLKDCLDGISLLDDNQICVAAGVTMSRAAVFAANHGLSGLEFAHGIPGTVGGGVYMNAGAYGGEISQICKSVTILTPDGTEQVLSAEQMNFSYRHSRLEEEANIVVSAEFQLTPKSESEIRDLMRELLQKRKASQPLEYPSAGSAFKRPVGGYAAALIDQAGLRGYRIGGAAVSEKHAGFVVNVGNATAEEVKSLLSSVAKKVYDHSGIRLEPEVRIW